LHAISCNCPNDCHQTLNQGTCSTLEKKCICKKEWRGKDCSLPNCPYNNCSNNGRCVNDRCICNNGFTGFDCSSRIIPSLTNPLPFGQLFTNERYYYEDSFRDSNPIFNLSLFNRIELELNQTEYNNMLLPKNIFYNTFIYGNMTFQNENILRTLKNIKFRVKGKIFD
jgi:hypothetical protein